MPRAATGSVYFSDGKWYASLTLGPKIRSSFALAATIQDEAASRVRLAVLVELAATLRPVAPVEVVKRMMREGATRDDGAALDELRAAVARLVAAGGARAKREASAATTFRELGERWTAGELSKEFPGRVGPRVNAPIDAAVLRRHIYGVLLDEGPWRTVGDVPLSSFTLDHAEAVLRALDGNLEASTRRQISGLMTRILSLAAFPCRIIQSTPIPRTFAPSLGPPKALQWLYPDEDAQLLACADVPLAHRVFYGVLAREGMRPAEGLALEVADLDLERGIVSLDRNKTRDVRAWAMDPGVVRALAAWLRVRPTSSPLVFALRDYSRAAMFRQDLETAGVKRAALFKRNAQRRPIRAHDLRATFITLSLAHGKTEDWVSRRTGHRSSDQINHYRRPAATAAELQMATLLPLDVAIPELRGSSSGEEGGGNRRGNVGDPHETARQTTAKSAISQQQNSDEPALDSAFYERKRKRGARRRERSTDVHSHTARADRLRLLVGAAPRNAGWRAGSGDPCNERERAGATFGRAPAGRCEAAGRRAAAGKSSRAGQGCPAEGARA